MVKFAAEPEEFATTASREPDASVITLAVTPKSSELISLATSESVSEPSAVIVVAVPLPLVMVKLPADMAVELLAYVSDVHEAVVARLFTTTS